MNLKIKRSVNLATSDFSGSDHEKMRQCLIRPVALFLDGMSRAVILPFGPSLVYRLVHEETLKLGLACARVVYPLTAVVSAYLLGRGVGIWFGRNLKVSDDALPKHVARFAGVAISLLVFTFGAGLQSFWWLVVIRFISACLVGSLCMITKEDSSRKDQSELMEDRLESGLNDPTVRANKRRDGYVDFASGTAKIYLTAFAVSILAGGLLYRHATGDATFQALTGSKQLTLSALFLVGVSFLAEYILRCVFAVFKPKERKEEAVNALQSGDRSQIFNKVRSRSSESTESSTVKNKAKVKEHGSLVSPTHEKSHDRIGSSTTEVFVQCRDRLESTNSLESLEGRERLGTAEFGEFFDCNSVISDMEDMPLFDEELGEASTAVAQYVDGKCLYANGAPAHVPNGDSPDAVPQNYLTFCNGNRKKAEAMWKVTQEWRRQHSVWRIHTTPHRWFPEIKKAYPHFIHGVSKNGCPIIYEQPGKMNLKQLFREGCNVSDMVRHYIFFIECISNRICTKEEVRCRMGPRPHAHNSSSWGIMVAMDVKGAGLSHLSGDVLSYLKSAGDINSSHYPLSLKRAFVINSPFWLAGAWKSIKGILPDSVQVDILSSHSYLAALREFIDDDQIPREYGGSSPFKLGEHPFELELHKLVEEASAGVEEHSDTPAIIETRPEPTYSFNHDTGTWTTEVDGLTMDEGAPHMNGGSWSSSISIKSPSRAGLHPRRRRAISTDQSRSIQLSDFSDDDVGGKKSGQIDGEADIFMIVSAMYALWSGIQGIIETAIPLWILIPPELGGLGYAPSRSGVALFCSTMVLLWVMRTKVSKVISKTPSKAPMRSFRIGVGAESVLLLLLATIPKTSR